MREKAMRIYELIWAIGWVYFVHPLRAWYRRHRRDVEYFARLGWVTGLLMSIMMILWGLSR